MIAKNNSNPKLFYQYVAKKDKYGDKSISLIDEGNIVSEPSRCGDILNNYFSTVLTSGPLSSNALIMNLYSPACHGIYIYITEEKLRRKLSSLDIRIS